MFKWQMLVSYYRLTLLQALTSDVFLVFSLWVLRCMPKKKTVEEKTTSYLSLFFIFFTVVTLFCWFLVTKLMLESHKKCNETDSFENYSGRKICLGKTVHPKNDIQFWPEGLNDVIWSMLITFWERWVDRRTIIDVGWVAWLFSLAQDSIMIFLSWRFNGRLSCPAASNILLDPRKTLGYRWLIRFIGHTLCSFFK